MERIYDSLIIGGGPAGISASIYVARYNRSALVIDRGSGRSTTHEINENYLGFPNGVASKRLRALGRRQARRFGVDFIADKVTSVACDGELFRAASARRDYHGRTIIFATGARDLFPEFEDVEDYIGRSLFWCITCDGYKVRDSRVMVVGHDDNSAVTALQFLNFTHAITFVTNREAGAAALGARSRSLLRDAGIEIYDACIADVCGTDGMMQSVQIDDGREIALDCMFNQQGSVPNSDLARSIGIATNPDGWIKIDDEQRTNISRAYAAGDVTRLFAHQIVTAAHEGSTAGQAANYDLYRPEQRES